jgi:hypothetical protein
VLRACWHNAKRAKKRNSAKKRSSANAIPLHGGTGRSYIKAIEAAARLKLSLDHPRKKPATPPESSDAHLTPSEPGVYPKGPDELRALPLHSLLQSPGAAIKPTGWKRVACLGGSIGGSPRPPLVGAMVGTLSAPPRVLPLSRLPPGMQALTLASCLAQNASSGGGQRPLAPVAPVVIVRAPLGSSAVVVLLQKALKEAAEHLGTLLLTEDEEQMEEDGVQVIHPRPKGQALEELRAALELYRALARENVADLLERSKWLERGQR